MGEGNFLRFYVEVYMSKKIILLAVGIVCVLSIVSCSKDKQKRYSAEFLELFNTASQIIAYTETKDEFESYVNEIYGLLLEYHKLYDIYNEYDGMNNLKTINRNAGIRPIKVDKRIIDLLLFSKEMYTLTQGRVNVAMGSVLEIWHEYRTMGIDSPDDAILPPISLLEERNELTNINNIVIDVEESTVYLKVKGMSLDVGGIAKGYATEQVSQIMVEKGLKNALYSIGGNVRAIGVRVEDNTKWNVGVQNPDLLSENYLEILNLSNLSLVTSGVYQRYYTVNGKEYHHIIDNDTLMPSDYFIAVSIVCEDSGRADALSTAIFNMSYEEGLDFVEQLENTEALWVLKDGSIVYSEGFHKLIKTKEVE